VQAKKSRCLGFVYVQVIDLFNFDKKTPSVIIKQITIFYRVIDQKIIK